MNSKAINFEEKLQLFSQIWTPKIIAQMNDYHFKLAKIKGHFTRHDLKDTDEVFEVPKGILHKPYSETECKS